MVRTGATGARAGSATGLLAAGRAAARLGTCARRGATTTASRTRACALRRRRHLSRPIRRLWRRRQHRQSRRLPRRLRRPRRCVAMVRTVATGARAVSATVLLAAGRAVARLGTCARRGATTATSRTRACARRQRRHPSRPIRRRWRRRQHRQSRRLRRRLRRRRRCVAMARMGATRTRAVFVMELRAGGRAGARLDTYARRGATTTRSRTRACALRRCQPRCGRQCRCRRRSQARHPPRRLRRLQLFARMALTAATRLWAVFATVLVACGRVAARRGTCASRRATLFTSHTRACQPRLAQPRCGLLHRHPCPRRPRRLHRRCRLAWTSRMAAMRTPAGSAMGSALSGSACVMRAGRVSGTVSPPRPRRRARVYILRFRPLGQHRRPQQDPRSRPQPRRLLQRQSIAQMVPTGATVVTAGCATLQETAGRAGAMLGTCARQGATTTTRRTRACARQLGRAHG